MRCPYCSEELEIQDEWYEFFPKRNAYVFHFAGGCAECNRDYDWEEEYVRNTSFNTNFREIVESEEGVKVLPFLK